MTFAHEREGDMSIQTTAHLADIYHLVTAKRSAVLEAAVEYAGLRAQNGQCGYETCMREMPLMMRTHKHWRILTRPRINKRGILGKDAK